ncbi:MAG: rod shape-determining protein MreD [Acetobacteraceae bacterium]|nr:rod shape-determining protein MreD [Acetobacteraceae bacterium]
MDRIGPTPEIRRRPTLGRRLDFIARVSFPVACTLLLMLLTAMPFGVAGQAAFLPAIALASVWFWSLFRPASMPAPAVFLIGLVCDLLGYVPLGVGVLTLLLVHGIAARSRRILTHWGFLPIWLAFLVLAAGAAALGWALTSLMQFRLKPAGVAVFEWALAGALYPALAILFARAHRTLADPERA